MVNLYLTILLNGYKTVYYASVPSSILQSESNLIPMVRFMVYTTLKVSECSTKTYD